MNKFSIVLTLLLCGSCALALDPNLEKTKSATGIDLPTAKWLFWEIKFLMKQANMWVHKPKILKKRFAGNNLSCSSCHANGGSVQNQSGFVGIQARFPQYNARGDKVITLADRINGCFERSMNGKRMPSDTPGMKAMLTYMQWLSQEVPVGAKIEGQGLKKIDFILRADDPKKR